MELLVFQRGGESIQALGALTPGNIQGGFREGCEYLFRIPTAGFSLYIDDAPLVPEPSGLYWCWSPGFLAGEVVAELESPFRREPVRYLLDVEPTPSKTGREQYFEYIAEIAHYAPRLLLGTEPARHGLGGRSSSRLTVWINYARLRCFFDDYLKALQTVCEHPLFRQRHHREQVRLHSAHRVDRQSIQRLRTNPNLFTAIALRGAGGASVGLQDDRLDVPLNEPTFDHPANRLLAEQLNRVKRMVFNLQEQFTHFQNEGGDTETAIQPRLERRLRYLCQMQQQLLRIGRKEPFMSADAERASAAGITAVTASPGYARSHRLGVRILRQGMSGLAEDERHYLAPTWQVYESWCFVALARQFEQLLPDFDWHLDAASVSADMILTGLKGVARFRLYGQMVCPSLERANRYGYTSISRERRPDLVLEYRNEERLRFICLDAKYRTSRPGVLDGMASAHIYRDSVKFDGNGPEYSLLLVPNCTEAALLSSPEYLDRNKVGCLSLASPQDAGDIVKQLVDWGAQS